MNDAFRFGLTLECVSRGVSVASFPKMAGVAKRMSGAAGAPAKRLLLKTAHDIMTLSGDGNTAPANHLRILSEMPGWSAHADDVYSTVVKSCALSEAMEKRAMDPLEAAGELAKGVGYAGVLGGAGAGSLYWLLSRHANQDTADIEAQKQKLKYYKNLNNELKETLTRKYQYPTAVA